MAEEKPNKPNWKTNHIAHIAHIVQWVNYDKMLMACAERSNSYQDFYQDFYRELFNYFDGISPIATQTPSGIAWDDFEVDHVFMDSVILKFKENK